MLRDEYGHFVPQDGVTYTPCDVGQFRYYKTKECVENGKFVDTEDIKNNLIEYALVTEQAYNKLQNVRTTYPPGMILAGRVPTTSEYKKLENAYNEFKDAVTDYENAVDLLKNATGSDSNEYEDKMHTFWWHRDNIIYYKEKL